MAASVSRVDNEQLWKILQFLENESMLSINATGELREASYRNRFQVPTTLLVLLTFLYVSISLLAIFGNSLVIIIIAMNGHMHTVTNVFIANLAVADVIIGIFSIPFQFQAALLQRWVLANILCTLAPMVQVVSVNVSIFTLTVIATDRYIAVLRPLHAGCSPRWAAVIITVIWVAASAFSLPYALYFWVDRKQTINGESIPWCMLHSVPGCPKFFDYYACCLVAVQYVLPLVIISFCYCRIACHIWGSRQPGDAVNTVVDVRGRNRKKVVKMMIIVVCLFVICWLPLQLYNFLSNVYSRINQYTHINIIWFCSNWLAMSNSCYNPFIYGILNAKFKREFQLLFSKLPGGCVPTPRDHCSDYNSEDNNHYTRRGHSMHYNRCPSQRRSPYRSEARRHCHPIMPREKTESTQI